MYKLERKLRVKHFLCYFKEFILLFFRVSAEIIEFSIRYPKTGFVFLQDIETVRRSDCIFTGIQHQRSIFRIENGEYRVTGRNSFKS